MEGLRRFKCIAILLLLAGHAISAQAQEDVLYAKVKKSGKYGLITNKGQVVLQPQYAEMGEVGDGLVSFKSGDLWGAVDVNGKQVLSPRFAESFMFQNGLALVMLPNKPGNAVVDKTGKVLFQTTFGFVNFGSFASGLEPVTDPKTFKYGLLNKAGKLAVNCEYDEIKPLVEDRYLVKKGKYYGYLDKTGKLVIKTQFDEASNFTKGLAVVKQMNKSGVIDLNGQFIMQLGSYNKIYGYDDGTLRVVKSIKSETPGGKPTYKTGFADHTGKVVIGPSYESIGNFHEGKACVLKDGKYGYVDSDGQVIINCQFENLGDFSEGLALLTVHDKSGFIDATGKIVIKPQFESAHGFHEGVAIVGKGEKFGLIDKTGKLVAAMKYNEINPLGGGLFRVLAGSSYGIINAADRNLVSIEYEEIGAFSK